MSIYKNTCKDILDHITENKNLASLTWFKVGGKSNFFFQPPDEETLIKFIKNKPKNIKIFTLGSGSNVLIRDNGFKGVVIHMIKLNKIQIDEKGIITAQSGTSDADLSRFARNNSRTGLEFLIGIPGSIGGGIKMNSGAFGSEFKNVLIDIKAINKNGIIKIFKVNEMKLEYRKNNLSNEWIFLSARFKSKKGNIEEIQSKMKEIILQRKERQPTGVKTGGSTFMNSKSYKAWELIHKAGCRGMKCGDAQISEKHCNFIINTDKALAKDIETLGENVRKKVFLSSGKKLEWEIKIVGEK